MTGGFHSVEACEAALARAGLVVLRRDDLSDQSIAGLRYLHHRSARFFPVMEVSPAENMSCRFTLLRNAVAGLVGPYMIEGAGPNSGDTQAAITYSVLMAEKPH